MSSVFFTDTDCEMYYTDAEALGINVIGMPYTIKGQEKKEQRIMSRNNKKLKKRRKIKRKDLKVNLILHCQIII